MGKFEGRDTLVHSNLEYISDKIVGRLDKTKYAYQELNK